MGATQARVAVLVPGAGWIWFDPTNRVGGSAGLIPVAVARRIDQVAAVTGGVYGSAVDRLAVEVTVTLEVGRNWVSSLAQGQECRNPPP